MDGFVVSPYSEPKDGRKATGRDSYDGRPTQEVPMDFHSARLTWSKDKTAASYSEDFEFDVVQPRDVAARGHQWPASQRPETAMEAIMRAAPFQDVEVSLEELEVLGDVLATAVDGLSHPERYVLEQTVIARRTLRGFTYEEVYGVKRKHGRTEVPKTTVARLRDRALDKLADQLEGHPDVIPFLK